MTHATMNETNFCLKNSRLPLVFVKRQRSC